VFSAVASPAATSNYSRQLHEDSYQIFPPMTFEINSFDSVKKMEEMSCSK